MDDIPKKKRRRRGTAYSDADVLEYIDFFWRRRNYSPSLRDIKSACDINSLNTVFGVIKSLKERGLVHHQDGLARSIVLTPAGKAEVKKLKENQQDELQQDSQSLQNQPE